MPGVRCCCSTMVAIWWRKKLFWLRENYRPERFPERKPDKANPNLPPILIAWCDCLYCFTRSNRKLYWLHTLNQVSWGEIRFFPVASFIFIFSIFSNSKAGVQWIIQSGEITWMSRIEMVPRCFLLICHFGIKHSPDVDTAASNPAFPQLQKSKINRYMLIYDQK